MPTTLIGLIDASVSNRVAVNWNGLKNRLGGYHEPLHTIIDATFLKTLPEAEVRNGIAEILKISSCTHIATFETLEQSGVSLVERRFGHIKGDNGELAGVADTVIRQGKRKRNARRTLHTHYIPFMRRCTLTYISSLHPAIQSVLEVEVPNSREQSLDRVMYFGHTWSPVLELAVSPPLLHGHAISVDMCFSATLAHHLGLLGSDQYHRFLRVFSTLGLALDHPAFTLKLMKQATNATIATRDGRLRAPVPTGDLGSHEILQMVDEGVLSKVWEEHKAAMEVWPRKGLGLDMDIAIRSSQLPN